MAQAQKQPGVPPSPASQIQNLPSLLDFRGESHNPVGWRININFGTFFGHQFSLFGLAAHAHARYVPIVANPLE
jgi:hypothetical protein